MTLFLKKLKKKLKIIKHFNSFQVSFISILYDNENYINCSLASQVMLMRMACPMLEGSNMSGLKMMKQVFIRSIMVRTAVSASLSGIPIAVSWEMMSFKILTSLLVLLMKTEP